MHMKLINMTQYLRAAQYYHSIIHNSHKHLLLGIISQTLGINHANSIAAPNGYVIESDN